MAVEILSSADFNFNCHECDDVLRKERGCTEKGIIPFRTQQETIYRCPLTIITPITWEYIKAYGFYEKSLLPNGNGWNNESNKYVQAMMVLSTEFNKTRQIIENRALKHGNKSRT